MNSENSKRSDPCRLLLNLFDKIKLKRSDKYVVISNLGIKKSCMINLKYQLRHGMKSLNSLMDHILYLIFKITLKIS